MSAPPEGSAWDFPAPHVFRLRVPADAIDEYRHVNNAVYLQWLDLAAWSHSEALGVSPRLCVELNRGMVVLRAEIDYNLAVYFRRFNDEGQMSRQRVLDRAAQLWGRLSGIALPKLVVDTPGGFGKVPIGPDYVIARRPGVTRFRTPRGVEVEYFDPGAE